MGAYDDIDPAETVEEVRSEPVTPLVSDSVLLATTNRGVEEPAEGGNEDKSGQTD